MSDNTISPNSAAVQQRLSAIWANIAELSEMESNIDGSLTELAELFGYLAECKTELGAIHYRFSRRIANMMTRNEEILEGVGTLKRWKGKKRKNWEHDRIIENVRARARDEIECDDDGVVTVDETDALLNALRRCARFEWKVTGLVDMGIDADHFCDTEDAPATVSFKPTGS